jgi:hypothetical protein
MGRESTRWCHTYEAKSLMAEDIREEDNIVLFSGQKIQRWYGPKGKEGIDLQERSQVSLPGKLSRLPRHCRNQGDPRSDFAGGKSAGRLRGFHRS